MYKEDQNNLKSLGHIAYMYNVFKYELNVLYSYYIMQCKAVYNVYSEVLAYSCNMKPISAYNICVCIYTTFSLYPMIHISYYLCLQLYKIAFHPFVCECVSLSFHPPISGYTQVETLLWRQTHYIFFLKRLLDLLQTIVLKSQHSGGD